MGIVVHWYPASLMSFDRNSYMALFLSAGALIPEEKGMVSSTKVTDAGSLRRSTRVISGRLFVSMISTGTVELPTKAPSRSA